MAAIPALQSTQSFSAVPSQQQKVPPSENSSTQLFQAVIAQSEPTQLTARQNLKTKGYPDKQKTTPATPILYSSDENFHEKDLKILGEMLALLEEYEKGGSDALSTLKQITSLCGGASGITYENDNPKCIRNRYGRDRTIEPKGFINFALLHRAFIVLETGLPSPQAIQDDLRKLKSKIVYILEKETSSINSPSSEGNEEELSTIYQYAKDNYYDISIPRIATELHSLLNETIATKEDLYFFGRKLIIIGELCHEIQKDIRNIEDNEDNSDRLKEIIEVFKAINKERNNFVHPGDLVKDFLKLDQDNKLKLHLYNVIKKCSDIIKHPNSKEILKKAISMREISEKGIKQRRKKRKEKTVTLLEKQLQKSEEYACVLEACRTKETSSLSTKERQSIKLGQTPEVDKLINIGNKLNIFWHVNALKTLRVKLMHASKMEDEDYRKCFDTVIGSDSFDITSLQDCERVLKKIATLSTQSEWKLKDEFSNQSQMPLFFSKLKYFLEIYNDSQMSSLEEMHQTLSQSADQNGSHWVLRKGVKGSESFNKLKSFHANLTKTAKAHEQCLKKPEYTKAVSLATQGITDFSIQRKEDIAAVLNTIATLKEGSWKAKEKSHESLVQVLASSCSTHVIRDPRALKLRIKKELKEERTRLTQKIDEEIYFIAQINRRADIDPQRKRAIQEYVVTTLGQWMRELKMIKAFEYTLLSKTALHAGCTMLTHRSKGLAHEILRFDSDQFEDDLKKIILPATNDFRSIHLIQALVNTEDSNNHHIILGVAYRRLNCFEKANEHFKQALANAENPAVRLKQIAQIFPDVPFESDFVKRLINIQLIITTAWYAQSCLKKEDYQSCLEAIEKILAILNQFHSHKNPKLNIFTISLYLFYARSLYFTARRDINTIVSAYNNALKIKCDKIFKLSVFIIIAIESFRLSKERIFQNKPFFDFIHKIIKKIQTKKIKSSSTKYVILVFKLSVCLFKKQFSKAQKFFYEIEKFINNNETNLKKEMGDRSHFLRLHFFSIQITLSSQSLNLEKLLTKFDSEYNLIKSHHLHKCPEVIERVLIVSKYLRNYAVNNVFTNQKLFEWLEKSWCYLKECAPNKNKELKRSAYFLAHTFFMYRQRGNYFEQRAFEVAKAFDLNFKIFSALTELESNLKKFKECRNINSEEAINLFSNILKDKKILDVADERDDKMLTLYKKKRKSLPTIALIPERPSSRIHRTRTIAQVRFQPRPGHNKPRRFN